LVARPANCAGCRIPMVPLEQFLYSSTIETGI
jgi:hypothetical protein